MSQKDTITKNYMKDVAHFADFFNGYIYKGREVIKPDSLSEVDTSSIAQIPYDNGKKQVTVQKYRDVLKNAILKKSNNVYYLLLGIENQSDIHYAMPIRNMLYNALTYAQQVEIVAKNNRKNKTCKSNDFLSGFTKDDKIIPVITVTVYWGTEKWDAPTRLKEMLVEIDDETERLINDFDCNVFSIIDAEELPLYKTELNELFRLLRVRNDSNELLKLVADNEEYKNIDRETAVVMREFSSIKLPRKNKAGGYDMCKAVMDLKVEGEIIGIKKGESLGMKKLVSAISDARNGMSYENLIKKYDEETAKNAWIIKWLFIYNYEKHPH